MRTMLTFLFFASAFATRCLSQSITPFIIHSTGASYSNSDQHFFVDWNVGEMALTNTMQYASGENLFVITNGFLQPEKAPSIYLKTQAVKTEVLTIQEVKVFPNPTSDKIRVQFMISADEDIELTLYNSMGQQVYSRQISASAMGHTEDVPMHNLIQGTYLLLVKMTSGETTRHGTFKIVKTN